MNDYIYSSWEQFIENDSPQFPREVGRWSPMRTNGERVFNEGYPRFQVDSLTDYLHALERYQGVGATTSIYSLPMKENKEINKLFIEIGDSTTIYIAHKMMQGVCLFLHNIYSIDPYVQYTNSKSFHVYIGFPQIKLRPTIYKVPEEVIKVILERAMEVGFVKTKIVRYLYQGNTIIESSPNVDVDWQVVSDSGRCGRMPYTNHIHGVRNGDDGMVVPIDWRWSLHRIMRESKEPSFKLNCNIPQNDDIYSVIKNIEESLWYMEKNMIQDTPKLEIGDMDFKSQIENLLNKAPQIGDGYHRICMHLLLPYCKYSGLSWDQSRIIMEQFLRRCGQPVSGLVNHAKNNWWDKNKDFAPMRIDNFVGKYPELGGYF